MLLSGQVDFETAEHPSKMILAPEDIPQPNIKRVEELVDENRRISLRAIEALTSLNIFTIHAILHDYLEMRKRKSRWVPHDLTPENKQK